MIDINIIELKIIYRALYYQDHTDIYLLPKHFENKELADIWEEVKDKTEINVLEMTARHSEDLLNDIIKNMCAFDTTTAQLAEMMIENYTKNIFLTELGKVSTLVSSGMKPEIAMKQLSDLVMPNTSSSDPEGVIDVMRRVYFDIQSISNGEKESNMFIPTGMKCFDDVFFGIERSAYTVVAARSSMGKSSFAMNIATNVAKTGKGVLFISLEMSNDSLGYRLLSSESKLDLQLLRTGKIKTEGSWTKLSTGLAKMAKCNKMFLDDSSRLTLSQLLAKVRRHKKKNGLDLLVVDYLGLLSTDNKNHKKHEYISEISNAMPGLAKELDIGLVALAQIGREVEKRPDKRPMMSDLRDSGSIEQDADAIIMLYREEYYNKTPANDGIAEIIVQKQRNGPTGSVITAFDKVHASFTEAETEKKFSYENRIQKR